MTTQIITDQKFLRVPCEPATIEEAQKIGEHLEAVSKEIPNMGLAASQIGIQKQVCLIREKDSTQSYLLCNPKIINQYEEFIYENEGCLSIPNQRYNTKRFRYIHVKDDFHPQGFIAGDTEAVILQHEIGHCNGELFTDYAINNFKVGRNEPCPQCLKIGKAIKFKKCKEHFLE